MPKIVNKLILGKNIKRIDIEAPQIAANFHLGQFLMVCPEKGSEWIPLAIADADPRRNIISVIFKEKGPATRCLGALPIHEEIFSISGPFGRINSPKQFGVVVCVATDVYAAQILPICKAYSRAENKVIGIISAKTKTELILEPQMRIACHKLLLSTEDGSYQRRGNAFGMLKKLFDEENVNLVYSIGDTEMMREIAVMTKERNIPNLIQVQTMMVCGRGICGSCRVKVKQQVVLSCEEGPEFDGHQMDFDYLKHRMERSCHHQEGAEPMAGAPWIFKRFMEED
ncbi:MAG: sulfide/dihydroorotate dehydrogenase-like FAD/NAD-binding protein [Candidatus Omnitrophota bacterium]